MRHHDEIHFDDLPEQIKAHIETLEVVRRDFVANVSHELRTPLTVIRGYLETLLTQVNDDESKKWNKIFHQMYQHSLRMENLIEDLLLLSRLESVVEKAEMMPEISVAKMLQTLCDEAKAISGDKHHKIVLNIDKKLILRGYPNELKSLFSNLIINAIKYTPEKGEIRIQWFKEGDEAVFQVVDAGIGIDKAEIPRLTERFYRVDKARSREDGGTGLGLAIVKHVLMRHGGELQITSQLGKGSTFRCVFTQSSHKRKLPVQCGE